MPEIKNTFNQGKMNKDLDERLVENGQYRNAMNIQVSTSEGSDVGAVQNILGNKVVFDDPASPSIIPKDSICVGAIADEKNNCFYWFTHHSTKNLIIRHFPNNDDSLQKTELVFVDRKNVLGFTDKIITGINIIDNLLFWTDNLYEPKKINVDFCFQGTNQSSTTHTKLIVPERDIDLSSNIDVEEENITVIKKSPTSKLIIDARFEQAPTAKTQYDFDEDGDGELMINGETGNIAFYDFNPDNSSYKEGDIILLLDSSSDGNLPEDYTVKIKLLSYIAGTNSFVFKIITISEGVSFNPAIYLCQKQVVDLIFSRKFVRFGYRYKYRDNEYSTFSPFTEPIFKPGDFEYNSLKAHNTAMENNLVSLNLRNFLNFQTPLDVVQIDILYKESDSPIVYIVDKIKKKDPTKVRVANQNKNFWDANLYEISNELIYAAVSSDQLIRPWDNVPRRALAQEVTGSRIVYGNYLQNYSTKKKPIIRGDYIPRYVNNTSYGFNYFANMTNQPQPFEDPVIAGFGQQSLKSQRTYQLGVTYLDDYNRETPVFTSVESTFKIPKKFARNKLKIQGKILSDKPSWATYFKAYVKETSTEYYNLAMSRSYRAEDGNLWLAFPSSERNKIDEETFLILKKSIDSNTLVEEEAKYKVLSIKNEVPEYLKTELQVISEFNCSDITQVFGAQNPQPDDRTFDLEVNAVDSTNIKDLHLKGEDLFIAFKDSANTFTKKYDIAEISFVSGNYYNVALAETFSVTDSNFFYTDYPDNTTTDSTLTAVIYKSKVLELPEFRGVFFVKINSDEVSEKYVIPEVEGTPSYEVKNALFSYYFSDTAALDGGTGTTQTSNQSNGATSIGRTNSKEEWKALVEYGAGPGTTNPILNQTPEHGMINGFFIDQACYVGIHPKGSCGKIDVDNPNHVWRMESFDSTDNSTVRFGKGVYTQGGKHYVELSFSTVGRHKHGEGEVAYQYDGSFGLNYDDFNDAELWEPGNNELDLEIYQLNYGGVPNELRSLTDRIAKDSKFRVKSDDNANVYTIKNVELIKRYNHTNWADVYAAWRDYSNNSNTTTLTALGVVWKAFSKRHNRRITYKIEIDKPLTDVQINGDELLDTNNISAVLPITINFVEPKSSIDEKQKVSKNPAIWETEPKDSADLDIYYEASEAIPLRITQTNGELFIPRGSVVTCPARPKTIKNDLTYVQQFSDDLIFFNVEIDLLEYRPLPQSLDVRLIFTRPDGSYRTIVIDVDATNTAIADGIIPPGAARYIVKRDVSNNPFALSWFNCYTFNNGVESNRIRDDFNQKMISKGVKASTVLDEVYKEERRSSGLIYSGIYNSNSGVNNLNQFIQAEKITKDLNPTYGSIQKLFSRQTDLISFCEDRVIRISANKDAIFNADGNPQLIATNNVLGQTLPFSGDYGISKNPESFASENYRAYFADRQRGTVLRLSMDGITPISDYGMSDYFKDNLKNADLLILGTYDDKKREYNLSLKNRGGGKGPVINTTLSFDEKAKGWSSFKSFVPENGVSVFGNYYTMFGGFSYEHHVEQFDADGREINRNTFYWDGVAYAHTDSSIEFLLNQAPGVVKSFKTLNYEGSQSNIVGPNLLVDSSDYYNLENKDGWKVNYIETDKQKGNIVEFIEKEGKWFNYIRGKKIEQVQDINTNQFSFQGIGKANDITI